MNKKQYIDENMKSMAMNAMMEIGLTEDEADLELTQSWNIAESMEKPNNEAEEDLCIESIGSTGFGQFGDPDQRRKERFEWKFLKNLIFNSIGLPPKGSRLVWSKNPYEHGHYYDLEYHFKLSNKSHESYIEKLFKLDIEAYEAECEAAFEEENWIPTKEWEEEVMQDNKIFEVLN